MKNVFEPTEDCRLPLVVLLVLIGCDNCIINYNPKHHLAPYLKKVENVFELLELVKKDWNVDTKCDEAQKKYILDSIHEKEILLIKFKDSLLS